MDKLLFVYTNNLNTNSGGVTGTKKALFYFSQKFDVKKMWVFQKHSKFSIFYNSLLGYLKSSWIQYLKIKRLIISGKYKIIYFDDSTNGKIIEKIKKRFPKIFIIVNFHNDEVKYYYYFYKTKGLLYYFIYRAALLSQQRSINFSDYKIFVTETDKQNVCNSTESHIIPVLLKDDYHAIQNKNNGNYFLFFGCSFFANDDAVKFILNNIAPYTNEKIVIAGTDMDKTFGNTKLPDNVSLLGYVEDLNKLFAEAKAFICPVFIGSGMKVKIAEALMHGKTIICSSFSAIGYKIEKDVFYIADTKEQFLYYMANCRINGFNEKARQLYLKYYDERMIDYYYDPCFQKYLSFVNKTEYIKNDN